MTYWGYRLNDVIENEATRLGWYPVTGLVEAFRGHGYCAYRAVKSEPQYSSWFRSWSESESNQNDMKGMIHPNLQGHTAWAARYLAAIAAPKPAPVPDSTVVVHLRTFRLWVPGSISPTGSNGTCNGNSVSGIRVKLLALMSLSEAGFDKPEATATYQFTVKSSDGQFQPSGWYQFPSDAIFTFPLSSVDKALDITVESPVCGHPGRGGEPAMIHLHRMQQASGGRSLAGLFQLRSSPHYTGIEVSGCIDVVPATLQLPNQQTGLEGLCQLLSRAP